MADFLGKSNFIEGTVAASDADGFVLAAGAARIGVRGQTAPEGTRRLLSLRPEKIALLADGDTADNAVDGRILAWSYLGAGFALRVETDTLGELRATLPAWQAAFAPSEGLPVRLGWSADAAVPVEDDAP